MFSVQCSVFSVQNSKPIIIDKFTKILIDKMNKTYDGIILAVSHKEFLELELDDLKSSNSSVIFDTKAFLNRSLIDARL